MWPLSYKIPCRTARTLQIHALMCNIFPTAMYVCDVCVHIYLSTEIKIFKYAQIPQLYCCFYFILFSYAFDLLSATL